MTINYELDAAAAWQALMEDAAGAPLRKGLSAEKRRIALRNMFDNVDLPSLVELQDLMAKHVDLVVANRIDSEVAETCTTEELANYMREHLAGQQIKDLIEMRYSLYRARVFTHIDATAEDLPPGTPREIAVPECDKKFVRQGGKPKVKVDEARLMELLGPERTLRVFKTTVTTTTELDQDALLALVKEDPTVMETLRECVATSGTTPVSFHVRDLKG